MTSWILYSKTLFKVPKSSRRCSLKLVQGSDTTEGTAA
jgi:hypothetical protein